MMAGLSAFSVGFTDQNTSIESEKLKMIEEINVEVPKVVGNDTLVQAAEFVNTTREAVVEPPKENVVEPINVIDNATNLNYEENLVEGNLNPVEDVNTIEGLRYKAVMAMEATAYLPTDGSSEGLTATGIPATYGVVAVDPSVIPLGSRVYIPGYGEALAADVGGAIIGYSIDLCMETYAECMNFGRRTVTVYVLE